MNPTRRKQTLIVLLSIITLLLAVTVIFVAWRIRQDQRPDDSSASTNCSTTADIGNFKCENTDARGAKYTCRASDISTTNPTGVAWFADGFCCAGDQIFCGGNPSSPQPGACGCQPNDGVTTCNYYNANSCQQQQPGGGDLPPGGECSYDNQCASGNCINGSCSNNDQQPGQCPNGQSANWCYVFRCPNGDTDGNGKCEAGDVGVTQQARTGTACGEPSAMSLVPCYQVDYYSTGPTGSETNFCGYRANLNCPGTTSTSSSAPPARGICDLFNREPSGNPFPAGQVYDVRVRYMQCSQLNDRIRLAVFRTDGDGTVANDPQVALLTPYQTEAPTSNGRCRYWFRWDSTNITTSGTYAMRIGRVDTGGEFQIDTIEPNCRSNVQLQIGETSSSTSSDTSSTVTSSITSSLTSSVTSSDTTSSTSTASSGSSSDTASSTASSTVSATSTATSGGVSCGDPCDPNNPVCPTNHTCTGSGTCVLNECLEDGVTCDTSQCTVQLPSTALFEGDSRPLLVGLMLLLLGMLLNRYKIWLRALGYGKVLIDVFGFSEEGFTSDVAETIKRKQRTRK